LTEQQAMLPSCNPSQSSKESKWDCLLMKVKPCFTIGDKYHKSGSLGFCAKPLSIQENGNVTFCWGQVGATKIYQITIRQSNFRPKIRFVE